MDAIKLLKQDHETVEELFEKFSAASDRAYKTRYHLAQKICEELTVHAYIEETIFYPRVKELDEEIGDLVLESFEEHAVVKTLVAEIQAMSGEEENFKAKVTVLKEMVEHHVDEEQDELFPMVRKALDREDLVAMGEELDAEKLRVKREGVAPKRTKRSAMRAQSASMA